MCPVLFYVPLINSSNLSSRAKSRDLVLLLLFLSSSFLRSRFLRGSFLSRSLSLTLSFRLGFLYLRLFLRQFRSSELLPIKRNLSDPHRSEILPMPLQFLV